MNEAREASDDDRQIREGFKMDQMVNQAQTQAQLAQGRNLPGGFDLDEIVEKSKAESKE